MHPNPIFRRTEQAQALDLASQRGFGILSMNGEDAPITAHIPFTLMDGAVHAHLLASNPIWRALNDGPRPALLSVSGPDAYISPDWYGVEDQVPTWNYWAVNLRGPLEARPQAELRGMLDELSAHFEGQLLPKKPWVTDKMTPEIIEKMMRAIRPVRMKIDAIESTMKLGQNKTPQARQGAADGVEAAGIGMETGALAALMRALD